MTIDRLLRPNPRLKAEFEGMQETTKESRLPFRLIETNSCYSGGKQGVSDTFASALWGAELMYQLAQAGGEGINFHGGGYERALPRGRSTTACSFSSRQDQAGLLRPLSIASRMCRCSPLTLYGRAKAASRPSCSISTGTGASASQSVRGSA
jgi:hypothetical protein